MLIEPLPIFDCVYCTKDHKKVFINISERMFTNKYGKAYANSKK
jgi:ribosomal protein S17